MHKGQYQGLISGDAKGLVNGLRRGRTHGLNRNDKKIREYFLQLQRNGDQDDPLDIDYIFLLAVAQSHGYTLPSTNCQRSGSRLIKRLKRDRIWAAMDVLYVYATDGDQDFATLNWKYPQARQNTRVNTLTFTSNQGYSGNGTNSYLNTNFNMNSQSDWATQNNNCWVIGINSNPAGASMQDFGVRRTAGPLAVSSLYSRLATDLTSARVNSAVADSVSASNTNSIGDYVGWRTSSGAMSLDKDGATIGTDASAASIALANLNVFVGCSNVEGTPTEFSTRIITHWGFGGFTSYRTEWNTHWKEYFQSLGVSQSQPVVNSYNQLSWRRYVQPIINGSKNSTYLDYTQNTFCSIVESGEYWYLYYLGSSALIDSDKDRIFCAIKRKSNDVSQGWEKAMGGSGPAIFIDTGSAGAFDEDQVCPGPVVVENSVFKMLYLGVSGSNGYKVGLALGNGTSFTKYASNPVYSDASLGAGGITSNKVVWDPFRKVYMMFYTGSVLLGDDMRLAESTNLTSWTMVKTGMRPGNGLGFLGCVKYINGVFYFWFSYSMRFFSSISEYYKCFSSTDLNSFVDLGIQWEYEGCNEFGMATHCDFMRKPDGSWFMLSNNYRNQIGKTANEGEEFTCVKVAELNNAGPVPIASKRSVSVYPSHVSRHYSLAPKHFDGTNFIERVNGDLGSVSAGLPQWTVEPTFGSRSLDYVTGSGSQSFTFPNNGALFNPANFGVKLKIITTDITGTRHYFRIGSDIIVTLEAGNLQVILSADGVAETKKYISTADISKPTNFNYIDNHIYVGFTWIGGVLTLYNDFVPFTVTKTNDGALTNVNMSTSDVTLMQNTSTQMRSATILSNITDQQWIDLEIG